MSTTEPEDPGNDTEQGAEISQAVEWPPEAAEPAEEPAESLENDGTPGAVDPLPEPEEE